MEKKKSARGAETIAFVPALLCNPGTPQHSFVLPSTPQSQLMVPEPR